MSDAHPSHIRHLFIQTFGLQLLSLDLLSNAHSEAMIDGAK
jgi:hypothetical protein